MGERAAKANSAKRACAVVVGWMLSQKRYVSDVHFVNLSSVFF